MSELQHANAFVVQFRAETEFASGKLAGRVEHVASGRTATFESVQDLPRLLRQMLKQSHDVDQSLNETATASTSQQEEEE